MDIVCSPMGIMSAFYPKQGIMDITAAGFTDVLLDVAMFCPPGELEGFGRGREDGLNPGDSRFRREKARVRTAPLISENPQELHNRAKALLEQCSAASLRLSAARAPYLLWNTKQKDLDDLLLRLAQESIKLCGEAGCGYLIVKPLFQACGHGNGWMENREFYLSLVPAARENHVMILLENQCHDVSGHLVRGCCSDGEEAAAWVDRLNEESGEERFGFSMDVGTCCLCGQNIQEFLRPVGKRLKAVVLRDCDGHREASMLPFTWSGFDRSGTDWLGLIRGLRENGFDGRLILNFATTASAFSPLLRPLLMQLAKGVGEYFKWQAGIEERLKKYESVVLFGAGNMCRNYMKCYGEKYPPLFTCDNNKKLWGTEFGGLEVRPPESLKDLPHGCAIFICNIYYREIERQLRDMGIDNEIEFFSDEFMPSFYFDRVERGE